MNFTVIEAPIITIDGPSGVGKGTLSKVLSKILKWNILDSGAIYRVLAMEALIRGVAIDINYIKLLVNIASQLDISFVNKEEGLEIFFRGKSVNHKIYNEMIGACASKIAIFPEIRKVLLKYQKSFHVFPGLIANGRDMGTVVFPHATFKIFLNASLNVRCERRLRQLERSGFSINFNYLVKKLKERDNRDCTREVAPLVPANDSVIFNSTYLSLNEIVYGVLKCFYNVVCYDK